jgi:hypothetical protein
MRMSGSLVWRRIAPLLTLLIICALGTSCTTPYRKSLGGETDQTFGRIYRTDFNTAWQGVLDALKNSRLDVSNRDAGFIQTRWVDNTAEKNLIDSYGQTDTYLKTQYRFRVTVAQGSFEGKPSVKISVRKEQVVSRDVLEGFRRVETDSVEENTLLYRIGRIIFMRMKLAMIEERRTQTAIDGTTNEMSTPPSTDSLESDGELDPELN